MRNSTPNLSRSAVAALALIALLVGCSAPSGGGDSPGGDSGTSTDSGDSGSGSGDSGSDSGDSGNGVVDACTLIPDADLEAALGGPLAPEREKYPQSSSQLCRISSTASPPALLNLELSVSGRDAFERSRDNKDDIPDYYQPLTGIGDDAFAFGHEVTMLKGNYVLVVFLEGLPFDNVPDADRLQLASNLAKAAAAQLG